VGKAERTAAALLARARMAFRERGLPDFSATHVEVLGAEASYGAESRARAAREVLLRLVVVHAESKCLDLFARELGSVGISFAPGTTGIYNGRPKPTPQIRLFTFFVEKTLLGDPLVVLDGQASAVEIPDGTPADVSTATPGVADPLAERGRSQSSSEPCVEVPLMRLALSRSGDKGDTVNIAIIARDPAYVAVLREELTPDRVALHFRHLVEGPVRRFEAPGLHAFNFLLENALGGGGMSSLRIDSQGKAYGQMALEMLVKVPLALLSRVEAA
jgi:hypothetical protein